MFKRYKDAETEYFKLWRGDQEDKRQAIQIAEFAYENFQDNHHEIILDLIQFYGATDAIDQCKRMFAKGFEKGFWYPEAYLKKFFDQETFKEEYETWCEMRDRETKKSTRVYETYLPRDYDSKASYPLFVSLHGWGEDLKMFTGFWKSESLSRDFIHVSIQSSQILGSRRYQWTDMDKTREDVMGVLDEVMGLHKVDKGIYIGGFFQGATTAMILAMEGGDSFKGFVALNPSKHDLLNEDLIGAGASAGLRGSMITGDKDHCYDQQVDLATLCKKKNLACDLMVKENFGHWFPDDLGEKIDTSIQYIQEK